MVPGYPYKLVARQSARRVSYMMKKELVSLPAKLVVGISTRTNNQQEITPEKGRIWPCVMSYFHQNLAQTIPNRKNPGVTLCLYTDYESDHTGDYTYFIGEEVTSIENLPQGVEVLAVPAQHTMKFTTQPGNMPEVIRNAWFEIWSLSADDLGGKRIYKADFELYDERANTPDHIGIVVDIFIGINPKA